MVNPISSTHNIDTSQSAQTSQPPRPPQPPPQTQKSGELSRDTVTLRNAGDVDRDGNK